MAVYWDFKNKIGEVEIKQELNCVVNTYVCDIYSGSNCLAVVCWESEEMKRNKEYQFITFFNDMTHFKNCLGLTKEYKDNILKEWHIVRFDYNIENKQVLNDIIKMTEALIKAKNTKVIIGNFNYYKREGE